MLPLSVCGTELELGSWDSSKIFNTNSQKDMALIDNMIEQAIESDYLKTAQTLIDITLVTCTISTIWFATTEMKLEF